MKKLIFAWSLLLAGIARADVKPAAIFSDHMVLQQGMSAPVWGTAEPGEQVTVSIESKPGWNVYPASNAIPQKQTATAGADGRWMVKLNSLPPGAQLEMTVAGKNTVKITDVLAGEVWLGSGQSNMEFTVSKSVKSWAGVVNEQKEIAEADYPNIRMFTVKMKTSKDVLPDVEGQWQVCSPQTAPAFSAIGYFFSRELHKSLNRPIGFINTSYGASCAQAWISRDVLEANPKLKPVLEALDNAVKDYERALAQPPATAPTQAGGRRGGAARPPRNPFTDQHQPYVLHNAMLKGLQPYAIKGVLWYQGESITTGGTEMYTQLMDELIVSWRKQWGQGEFPFYFVQLAGQDANSNRPEVREAQARSLKVPNTAMAVTIDIGEKTDVHPHNKQDLGDRLARMARARDYNQKIEWSGPAYASNRVEGNSVRVGFTHAASGLVAKGGDLKWFQIAGEDRNFVDAAAKIEGDSITVSNPQVAAPKYVRYAWHRWPEGANLYNGDGLPAAPFRTDE